MQIYEVQQGEAQLIKEVTLITPKIMYSCLLSPHSSLHYVMEIFFRLSYLSCISRNVLLGCGLHSNRSHENSQRPLLEG